MSQGTGLHPLGWAGDARACGGPPAGGVRHDAAGLPAVRVPVAVYVPSPCAAWSRTLENILVHGEDLMGEAEKTVQH